MKDDPQRLLSEHGDADSLERELLASAQRLGPPAGAREQAWLGIARQIGAGAAAGAAAGSASTAAASSAAAAKAGAGVLVPGALATKLAVVLGAGGIALGGYFAAQRAFDATAPRAPAERRQPAPAVALAAQTPAAAAPGASDPARAEPEPTGWPSQRHAAAKPTARLAAESALLATARAQLRAGDARAAHATLQRLGAQFPRGMLVQEREVLAIELLAARGDGAAAARRARSFVASYPNSPHSARLSRFIEPP